MLTKELLNRVDRYNQVKQYSYAITHRFSPIVNMSLLITKRSLEIKLKDLMFINKPTKLIDLTPFQIEELITYFIKLKLYDGSLENAYCQWLRQRGFWMKQQDTINPSQILKIYKEYKKLCVYPENPFDVCWLNSKAALSWNLLVEDCGINYSFDAPRLKDVKRNIWNMANELSLLLDWCPCPVWIHRWYIPVKNRSIEKRISSKYLKGKTVDIGMCPLNDRLADSKNKALWNWLDENAWADKVMGYEKYGRYIKLELKTGNLRYKFYDLQLSQSISKQQTPFFN